VATATRQALLQDIALTITDYRHGEVPAPNATHVDRWVSQFDRTDQHTILEEMSSILRTQYVSRQTARDYIESLLTSKAIFGSNLKGGLTQTLFLRIQRKGNSQDQLLAIVDELLQRLYGVTLQACGATPSVYVYLDDCLFSGNTAWHDLHQWLPQAIPGTKLHVVFFATHTGGLRYLRNNLDPETASRGISSSYWSLRTFRNIPWQTQFYECLWPRQFSGDAFVDAYIRSLVQRCQGKTFHPRLFRPNGVPVQETLFSSVAARDTVERAFMQKSAYLVSLPANPKPQMRPLGYEYLESLGFGSLFVTYRNVSNNCPLALWWGDPQLPPTHPLSKWHPLFLRTVNVSTNGISPDQTFPF
jgi:hypothetical protein